MLLLSKQLSRSKWMAIFLMGLGLAVVQLAKSTESKASANAAPAKFDEDRAAIDARFITMNYALNAFGGQVQQAFHKPALQLVEDGAGRAGFKANCTASERIARRRSRVEVSGPALEEARGDEEVVPVRAVELAPV